MNTTTRHRCADAGLTAGFGLLVLAAAVGCETMRQDFGEFGESITPVSPDKAAKMMMDYSDPDNRRRGTVLISNSPFGGTDVYVEWYRDSVATETDPLVKAASITALGRFGRPEDAVVIALALDESQPSQVRWEAAKALQRLHNPAVVPVLLAALRNADEGVDIRVAAAIALGQYPQDRVFQALVAALESPRLSVNEASRGSLTTLTGQDHGLDSKAWLAWYNSVTNPFADQKEYLYPTYQREETFLEKMAFWSSKNYEKPAAPAGLDSSMRRTYQDSDETTEDETGR
jgi:hypothetical protein